MCWKVLYSVLLWDLNTHVRRCRLVAIYCVALSVVMQVDQLLLLMPISAWEDFYQSETINIYVWPTGIFFVCRYFPRVFGDNEDKPLQTSAALTGFKALTNEVGCGFCWPLSQKYFEVWIKQQCAFTHCMCLMVVLLYICQTYTWTFLWILTGNGLLNRAFWPCT